jgi:hypothetical protein
VTVSHWRLELDYKILLALQGARQIDADPQFVPRSIVEVAWQYRQSSVIGVLAYASDDKIVRSFNWCFTLVERQRMLKFAWSDFQTGAFVNISPRHTYRFNRIPTSERCFITKGLGSKTEEVE